jgi:hypothetical protein
MPVKLFSLDCDFCEAGVLHAAKPRFIFLQNFTTHNNNDMLFSL